LQQWHFQATSKSLDPNSMSMPMNTTSAAAATVTTTKKLHHHQPRTLLPAAQPHQPWT